MKKVKQIVFEDNTKKKITGIDDIVDFLTEQGQKASKTNKSLVRNAFGYGLNETKEFIWYNTRTKMSKADKQKYSFFFYKENNICFTTEEFAKKYKAKIFRG